MSTFVDAVNDCCFLKDTIQPGLRAMGNNAKVIDINDSKKLHGSVDIDKCTCKHFPNECRWDYVVGYDGFAYFIEVHPANTSNVKEMIKKSVWLESFLKSHARLLRDLNNDKVFYWIPSGKHAILKNSPQAKRLAQSRIIIKNKLHLK